MDDVFLQFLVFVVTDARRHEHRTSTIVETVPEAEFEKLVGNSYRRKEIPDDKIATGVQDSFSDARRNVVYLIFSGGPEDVSAKIK